MPGTCRRLFRRRSRAPRRRSSRGSLARRHRSPRRSRPARRRATGTGKGRRNRAARAGAIERRDGRGRSLPARAGARARGNGVRLPRAGQRARAIGCGEDPRRAPRRGRRAAAEATRLTEAGTLLGTAAYLAPEQTADGEITLATDVYSLGVVLYELLAGRPPYVVESVADLAAPRKLPPPLANVPPGLEQAVFQALAPDPAARPQSAAELARRLGSPPEPVTLPLGAPARARVPRRILVAAAALVVAAVGLVLGLTLSTNGGSKPGPAPRVQPLARSQDPAVQARELASWLRRYSR